jgi:hypothetical protein
MDLLKAGAKCEFNFGMVDFSQGVRVLEINHFTEDGEVNLISDILEQNRPILNSKKDFIELLVILQISTGFAESETGKFIGHSNKSGLSFLVACVIDGNEELLEISSNGELPELL